MSESNFPLRERLEAQFEVLAVEGREERTAALTWYTGAAVRRYDARGPYEMRFSMEPGAVRLERLASGSAPLLNAHRDYTVADVIGVIAKAWIENGAGKAVVRFSKREDVTPIWQDVADGILRNASMGVTIHALKDVTPEGSPGHRLGARGGLARPYRRRPRRGIQVRTGNWPTGANDGRNHHRDGRRSP